MVRSGPRLGSRGGKTAILGMVAIGLLINCPAVAQETRGYDDKLLRLSEILGAVHYLRELCGADEGQLWRDRMRELIDAEGSSALRRARLTRSFNKGYQGYGRTYRTCTSSAQTAINRFLVEATQLADGLVKDVP